MDAHHQDSELDECPVANGFDLGGYNIYAYPLPQNKIDALNANPVGGVAGFLAELAIKHPEGSLCGGYEGAGVDFKGLDVVYIENKGAPNGLIPVLAWQIRKYIESGSKNAGPFPDITDDQVAKMKNAFKAIFAAEIPPEAKKDFRASVENKPAHPPACRDLVAEAMKRSFGDFSDWRAILANP